ncbi:MAG: phage tail protein [Shimia sp.]
MIGALISIALGPFRFGVTGDAYQRMTQSAPYRWAPQARIGREPALQYLGPDVATLTISGTIHPHFRGGLRQVEAMRGEAGRGRPMMLVDGMGGVWRRWVITRVDETRMHMTPDGAPQQIDFQLELQSYGRDRG